MNSRIWRHPSLRIGVYVTALVLLMGFNSHVEVAARDDRVKSPTLRPTATILSTSEIHEMGSRLPMLVNRNQVPQATALRGQDGVTPLAFGSSGHPFTTKLASIGPNNRVPTHLVPMRQTGKLSVRFGSAWYGCTAFIIAKGLLVTAAHCVHDFGQKDLGWADELIFEPARFGSGTDDYALRFGSWTATTMVISSTYWDGTDVCLPEAPGVVCENDIAVIVVAPNSIGKYPGEQVRYPFYRNTNPYSSFYGMVGAQFTKLGYPIAFEGGLKMIRTDSFGYIVEPNNVVIGSAQTGGSSGGPWIMNFGANPSTTNTSPAWDHPNRVAAVTSWGYVDDSIMISGASRFGTNAAFTDQANIDVLINSACSEFPDRC